MKPPYVFWVDGIGKLFTQLWDNTTTKLELAASVTKVKAIRAWKNINIATHDQGVVAGYIKSDGKVYYRSYCEQEDNSYIWENEVEVTQFTGVAINLNMFITNDYRTGFIIENSLGKITWLITSRNWAGMGIAPEKFTAKPIVNIDLIPVNYIRTYNTERFTVAPIVEISDLIYGAAYIGIASITTIDDGTGNYGKYIRVDVIHNIWGVNVTELSLVDSASTTYNTVAVTNYGSYFVAEFADFNNASGDLTLTFTRSVAANDASLAVDNMTETFTPTGLVPTVVGAPEVMEVWNE